MKSYADTTRNAIERDLQPGDIALAKQEKRNKLTPPYGEDPYLIISRKGSMTSAKPGDKILTTNTSFFWKLPDGNYTINEHDEEEEQADEEIQPEMKPPDIQPRENLATPKKKVTLQRREAHSSPEPHRRTDSHQMKTLSGRVVRKPAKYADFVV